MMTIGTWLHTLFHGQLVGHDDDGNRYYRERRPAKGARARRWVVYAGEPEATKVPPHWHGWLHYTTDTVPEGPWQRYGWQKAHQPNRTGTPAAYVPAGHILRGGARPKVSADYEPWQP